MLPFRFESLKIWHQSREFANEVYRITAGFPESERFGLSSQMTRAANSINLNIAEGAGRDTEVDFSRFLGIAIGSAFEVASASFLALDRGYIDGPTHTKIYKQAEYVGSSINSFRKSLLREHT